MNIFEKALKKYKAQSGNSREEQIEKNVETDNFLSATSAISYDVTVDFAKLAKLGILVPDTPNRILAEEFRIIKRQILRDIDKTDQKKNDNANVVVVTSSAPDEGKTFVSTNLAMSIAMGLDHEVVLINADIIRSGMSRYFDVQNEYGLSDYLASDDANLSHVVHATNYNGLSLIFPGTTTNRSSELLSRQKMKNFLKELSKDRNRIIIIDTPPLLSVSDASILSSMAGQVLIVVDSSQTTDAQVQEAISRIDNRSAIKFILNKRKYPAFLQSYYTYEYDNG